LLGPSAAGPVILTLLIDMVITTSLCIALSRLDGADAHGARKAAKNALKGVATNPLPWSILLGALASAISLKLPMPIVQTVGLLADAASPVALFTIGAVLARSQLLENAHQHAPLPLRDYLPVAAIKLLLHPLLVLLIGAAAVALGVPLNRFVLTVMVLVAALPSASNASLLAERFGADNGRIARIILVSTAVAFVTFSLAVTLLT
jgi:predicted permease